MKIDNVNYTTIFYSVMSILFGIIFGVTTAFIKKFLKFKKETIFKN